MVWLPDDLKLAAPAWKFVPVAKNDDADLPDGPCKGLLVGAGGTANLVQQDGTLRENVPLQQGYNPLIVARLMAGGTASDIWALY